METTARRSIEQKGFMHSDLAGSLQRCKNESANPGEKLSALMFQLLATIPELSASNGDHMRRFVAVATAVVGFSFVTISRAEDWPQWGGPARDSVSKEKGLLQ